LAVLAIATGMIVAPLGVLATAQAAAATFVVSSRIPDLAFESHSERFASRSERNLSVSALTFLWFSCSERSMGR